MLPSRHQHHENCQHNKGQTVMTVLFGFIAALQAMLDSKCCCHGFMPSPCSLGRTVIDLLDSAAEGASDAFNRLKPQCTSLVEC